MLHPFTWFLVFLFASGLTVWKVYTYFLQKRNRISLERPNRVSSFPSYDSPSRHQTSLPNTQSNLNNLPRHSEDSAKRMPFQGFEPSTSRPGRIKLQDLKRPQEDRTFYGALGSGRLPSSETFKHSSQYQNKGFVSSKSDAPVEKQFIGAWGVGNPSFYNPSAHPIVNDPQLGTVRGPNLTRHVVFDAEKPSSKSFHNDDDPQSDGQYSNWKPTTASSDLSTENYKSSYTPEYPKPTSEVLGKGNTKNNSHLADQRMKPEIRDQTDSSEIVYDKKKVYSPKAAQLKLGKSFSKAEEFKTQEILQSKPTRKEEKNQKVQQKQHEIEQKAAKSLIGRDYRDHNDSSAMQEENSKMPVFLSDLSDDERDTNERQKKRRDWSLPAKQQPQKLVKISNEKNGSVPAFNAEFQNSQKLFDQDDNEEEEELPPIKPMPQQRFRIGEFPAHFKRKYQHKLEESRQFADHTIRSPQRAAETQNSKPKIDLKEAQKAPNFFNSPKDSKSESIQIPAKENRDQEKMKPEVQQEQKQQQQPFLSMIPQKLGEEKETKTISPEKPKIIVPTDEQSKGLNNHKPQDEEISSPTFGGITETGKQLAQQSVPETKKGEDSKALESKPFGLAAPKPNEMGGFGLFGNGGLIQPNNAKSSLFQNSNTEPPKTEPPKKQEESLKPKESETQALKEKTTSTATNPLFIGNGTSLGPKTSEPLQGLFSNNKTPSLGMGLFGTTDQAKKEDSNSNPLIPKTDSSASQALTFSQKDGESKTAQDTSGLLFTNLAQKSSSSGLFGSLQQISQDSQPVKEEQKGSLLGSLFNNQTDQKKTNPLFSGVTNPSMTGSLFSNIQKDK